jgi:hypothetical protein
LDEISSGKLRYFGAETSGSVTRVRTLDNDKFLRFENLMVVRMTMLFSWVVTSS